MSFNKTIFLCLILLMVFSAAPIMAHVVDTDGDGTNNTGHTDTDAAHPTDTDAAHPVVKSLLLRPSILPLSGNRTPLNGEWKEAFQINFSINPDVPDAVSDLKGDNHGV